MKIVLVLFLPVLATVLYWDGQRFDPDVFSLNTSANVYGLLPYETAGYILLRDIRVYKKDNLYEYINGHAEFFISAGFQELTVAEYAEKGSDTPVITVELYRMQTALQALGVMEEEVSSDMVALKDPYRGYISDTRAILIKGPFYVKVNLSRKVGSIVDVVERILQRIQADDNSLQILKRLPVFGKTVKTRYYNGSYRGYPVLTGVVEREYIWKDKKLVIFIKLLESREATELLKQALLSFMYDNGIRVKEQVVADRMVYVVDDPYEDRWYLLFEDGMLMGISGRLNDSELKFIIDRVHAFKT